MNIAYKDGEFICCKDDINYQAVLDDFKNAKQIRVLTYNISKRNYANKLIDELKKVSEGVDMQIITNIPSRFPNYYNSPSGSNLKTKYQQTLQIYLDKLNPEEYPSNPYVGFNFNNHAKIIGTDNIVYVGSANYSDESKDNIESGTLIRDKDFIQKLYNELFPQIVEESTPYFEDDFNILRLFIISMENKFSSWLIKFDEDIVMEDPRSKKRQISSYYQFDENDLFELESDLDELRSIETLIENTYSDEDEQYNDTIDEIEKEFKQINLDWMIDFVGVDSEFYNVLRYDIDDKACEYLEKYPDAYDENLDYYAEIAGTDANEEYDSMQEAIEKDVIELRDQISKIADFLADVYDKIMPFSKVWIRSKVDNTK